MFQHQFYTILSIIYLSLACEQTLAHCHGNNSHHSVRILQIFTSIESRKNCKLLTVIDAVAIYLTHPALFLSSHLATQNSWGSRKTFQTPVFGHRLPSDLEMRLLVQVWHPLADCERCDLVCLHQIPPMWTPCWMSHLKCKNIKFIHLVLNALIFHT